MEGQATQQADVLPWETTPASGVGELCGWCGRMIYVPAVPCSTRIVAGLGEMDTVPGLGRRCQFEQRTRSG